MWVDTPQGGRLFCRVLDGPDASGRAPTVVFEAGAAATRTTWATVQPAVAEFARAVVYDRAGLGLSEAGRGDPTLASMAAGLDRVLDHFGPGPYLLVGHSAGGPIVRLATAQHPERVVGMVLVDPTDESADMLFGRAFRWGERVTATVGVWAARAGLLPRLYARMLAATPASVRGELRSDGMNARTLATARAASRTFLDDLSIWRTDPPETGSIPLTVISGALATDGMTPSMRAAASASHRVRVAAAADGRLVVAEKSGHLIPATEPEVIVDEIRRLWDRAAPPT